MVDVSRSSRPARGTRPGSVFSGVPWEPKARGSSPAIAAPVASPMVGKQVADAGAEMGGAIKRSTMRPGGIAEEGFAGTARALPFQSEMEQSFGADLSGVKVYADGNAKQATEKLGAQAYVMGDRIAFNTATPDRNTVAHELTHVLQHTGAGGARPTNGETDSRGIDMAGEHEAEAVEAAVSGGKRAATALGGAAPSAARPKKVGPARKAPGGGFSSGLTFSPDSFKTGLSYQLWAGGPFIVPTPVPAVFAQVVPSVTVSCVTGVNWDAAEESETGLVLELTVTGGVELVLWAGAPHLANFYASLSAGVTGAFTYTLNKDTWTLAGGLSLASNFAIGVSVAAGILDYRFEFGAVDPIATLAGIQWQNGNFSAGAFEWGPIPQQAFAMIEDASNQGQQLISAGVQLGKDGVEMTTKTISSAADWSTDQFDRLMGGAGAIIGGAVDTVGDAAGGIKDGIGGLFD